MARGRLRVYLGAAPGVGKTYAMLADAQERRSRGANVVIGFVESHGRRLVAALAEGLEVVPRRSVAYGGGILTEMDLECVLRRRPQVALVDELAHANVPGSKNPKRWQDVQELLDAGIDVVSTLNIQHLESLNDVVAQITGVRQRETVPDEVVRRADQLELVDLSPEALRRRMLQGGVYPPDRIEAALSHYFRPGNLTALRELALLWLADRVDEGLQRYRIAHGIGASWETRERVVVAVSGGPESETLIRRAARISAQIPGSDLLGVYVARSDGLIGPDPAALARCRRLVESLGGSYHQVIGADVADSLLRFARAKNATQLVVGAARQDRLVALVTGREMIGAKATRLAGAMDVHLVTHERAAGPPVLRLPQLGGLSPRRHWYGLAVAVLLLVPLTVVLTRWRSTLSLSSELVIYLLAVVVVALVGGLYPALLMAVGCGLVADYYFTPPLHSFSIAAVNDVVVLLVFVATAVAVSGAVEVSARRGRQAARASAQAAALTTLAGGVLRGRGDLPALLDLVRETFGLEAVSVLERTGGAGGQDGRWFVVASAGDRPPEQPDHADADAALNSTLLLACRGRVLEATDRAVFLACAAEIAAGFAHRQLAAHAAMVDAQAAAEGQRAALLGALGQELATPVSGAKRALGRLKNLSAARGADEQQGLVATVEQAVTMSATYSGT